MLLNELKPAVPNKSKKRVGRGIGSGHGKTSCKGSKGQNSRSGGGTRPGFEGGQMPLHRRLPKRGFTNIYSVDYAIVNIEALDRYEDDTEITPELLVNDGVIKKIKDGVKILGNGDLTKKLNVKANKFSKAAVKKINNNGGRAEVI